MFKLLLFGICATFAVGQTPDKCFECRGDKWDSCNGLEHTCRVSEKCVSAVSALKQALAGTNGVTEERVSRRCSDPTLCDKEMSVNYRLASWKIKTSCGTNATLGSEAPKGRLKCYGCMGDPSVCTQTVECSEKETTCIKVSETIAGNLIVHKGCATDSMCKLRSEISDVTGPVIPGDVSCCHGDYCNGSNALTSTSSVCLLLLSMIPWMLS
ncbi:uncharacterized protein LOC134461072 [Engraulis encrasicolus]|uniref:uncharacterized protein LOC134461072 n=1 Tax=Engraulis encrasicolus TaxID=184585 RepID=UPI002FD41FF2